MNRIFRELKEHAPFTLFGAATGIIVMLMVIVLRIDHKSLEPAFEGFHALHIFLSAIVTTALYMRYKDNIAAAFIIGFVGSVGVATISDVVFPHHGGALMLKLTGESHPMHFHLPFIEEPWLIVPAAVLGIAFGIWQRKTKLPHSGHVLLSTWASLFYVVAHAEGDVNWYPLLPILLVVLFVSVWVPCCFSDIVFPMLFVGKAPVQGAKDTPE
jgi:hypothetical protein